MDLEETTKAMQVVLGGLGCLGRQLQRQLLEKGHLVRVIDRPPRSPSVLDAGLVHISVTFVPFHLGKNDPERLAEALRGVETVYSVVTPDVQNGTVRDFFNTNHIGMHHVVAACLQAGVTKLVHASSIAVTNHLRPSYNQREDDPLPAIETYKSAYDRSKRLGEEIVLRANCTSLKTCALRFAGLIGDPKDYYVRNAVKIGAMIGHILFYPGPRIDAMAFSDASCAMLRASDKLDDDPTGLLAGRHLFVTKCRRGTGLDPDDVASVGSRCLGWGVIRIHPLLATILHLIFCMLHQVATILARDKENLPGVPTYLLIGLSLVPQSFDNTLARKILDFEPRLTCVQALEEGFTEYQKTAN